MTKACSVLVLDDEPLILMDLEYAGEDQGCKMIPATTCAEADRAMNDHDAIDVAILDVSLAEDQTCLPVARELELRGIPYLLHSGNLDRHNEHVRMLDAPLIAKPASADTVIAAAIALFREQGRAGDPLAAR